MSKAVPEMLRPFLELMAERDASDLHLKVEAPPALRIRGTLMRLRGEPMTQEGIEEMFFPLLMDTQLKFYNEHGSLDLGITLTGIGRFRVNMFRQRGAISIAVRRVHRLIRSFQELHLPPVLADVARNNQGLVIVAGVTGSGKSTTLAAMIELINRERQCHIVTVEDPIEYLYEDDHAIVNQREVGIDVPTFGEALKYVVRADPDVILIGEMRDTQSFVTGMEAAETGHLVFGTLHTATAPQTLERILNFFPSERHRLVRQTLSFTLRAIICQRLLPAIDPKVGLVPSVEILLNTPSIRKLIVDAEDAKLGDAIRIGHEEGMQDFTESLRTLVMEGLVDRRVAFNYAPSVEALKMALKGIHGGEGGLLA